MSASAKPAKAGQMSSRLATMKFMQRAAASSPVSRSEPADLPPIKRRRTGDHPYTTTPNSDLVVIQEALAAEDLKRTEALERQAMEAGDTKWILEIKDASRYSKGLGISVVNAGYGTIDKPNLANVQIEIDEKAHQDPIPQNSGRKSFGNFGKAAEKTRSRAASDVTDNSDNGSNSDKESEAQADRTNRRIASQASDEARARRKALHKAGQAGAAQLAEIRRNREVKLNKLESISSGGGLRARGSPSSAAMTCHACGQQGHLKQDCPSKRRSTGRRF